MSKDTQDNNKEWVKFLSIAKSHKDSGFCGGCSYVENNLDSFLQTQRQRICEELEGIVRDYKCGGHKKLLNKLKELNN